MTDLSQGASAWANLTRLKTLRVSGGGTWPSEWSNLVSSMEHLHLSNAPWGEDCLCIVNIAGVSLVLLANQFAL